MIWGIRTSSAGIAVLDGQTRAQRKETVLHVGRGRHTTTALELPQQLTLGLEELIIVKETFTVQLSQIAQARGHIHSRHG